MIIMETKSEIRSRVLRLRENLDTQERERACVLMTERILGHQWFYGSDIFLGFAGFGSEIDTEPLLRDALRMGKQVYLPRVEGNAMDFYRIYSLTELTEGYKGILEPANTAPKYCYFQENAAKTMMLMPGVAFDRMRNRVGYGRGFYDRYLSDKEELQFRTLAVGFRCQMTEEIPVEEKDIRPCQVLCF